MRLSPQIYSSIKSHIQESIPNADVFLFGSRADDSAKGGDIDLLLLKSNFRWFRLNGFEGLFLMT